MRKHSGINGNAKNALELSKAIECYTPTRLNIIHTKPYKVQRINHHMITGILAMKKEKKITDIDVGFDGFLYFLVSQDDGTTLKNMLKIN